MTGPLDTGDRPIDEQALARAIADRPADAAAALAAVQLGTDTPLTAAGLDLVAARQGTMPAALWLDRLRDRGLLGAFAAAVQARGVRVGPEPDEPFEDHFAGIDRFEPQARSFRCRVLVGNQVVGSGCLIGPRLVLTSWHVIAVQAPGRPQLPPPDLRVRLSDGTVESVCVPPRFESFCGDGEFARHVPRDDGEVADRHDVAVLLLRRPAGMYLGRVPLPAEPRSRSSGRLFLVHYPAGEDRGIGAGRMDPLGRLTARWRHNVSSLPGSSGGPCFDQGFQLVGLHQGKYRKGGRLVPLTRFATALEPLVRADVAPSVLWSLDGTVDGAPVIGRGGFFEAVAAADDDAGPVRGVRVKRRDVAGGSTAGLAFSAELLRNLLARGDTRHVTVRIPFDEVGGDLLARIREQLGVAGVVPTVGPDPIAVAADTAAPAGAARDRAARLMESVGVAAAEAGLRIWFILDNPSVALSEWDRLLLDGVVSAVLGQLRLRLLVCGFETVALPGAEFGSSAAVADRRRPGLVLDYIGGFTRQDVLRFLQDAARALGAGPADGVLANAVDIALQDLTADFGRYPDTDLETVATALRPQLRLFARGAPRAQGVQL